MWVWVFLCGVWVWWKRGGGGLALGLVVAGVVAGVGEDVGVAVSFVSLVSFVWLYVYSPHRQYHWWWQW